MGRSIAETDVVAVPFGTLPDNFGIHLLPAKEHLCKGVAAALNVTSKEVKVPVSVTGKEVTKEVTSKRFCNLAEDHMKNMKKKTKVKSIEMKETGHGKKSVIAEVSNVDEFDFDDVEEQQKKVTKKKAMNHGRKPKIISVDGNDDKKDNDDVLVFPFILGQKSI